VTKTAKLVRREGDSEFHLLTTRDYGGGHRTEISCATIGTGSTLEKAALGRASELRLCEHCRPHIERLLEEEQ
jgi:hypothetical protein